MSNYSPGHEFEKEFKVTLLLGIQQLQSNQVGDDWLLKLKGLVPDIEVPNLEEQLKNPQQEQVGNYELHEPPRDKVYKVLDCLTNKLNQQLTKEEGNFPNIARLEDRKNKVTGLIEELKQKEQNIANELKQKKQNPGNR